jgi:hypothetical protein
VHITDLQNAFYSVGGTGDEFFGITAVYEFGLEFLGYNYKTHSAPSDVSAE